VIRKRVSRRKETIISEVLSFRKRNSAVLFMNVFVCFWRSSPQWARASSFTKFLDHTQRRTTVDRTPLDEWSDRCRDLYLTTHNTHSRNTFMPPVGFELTISAGERSQTVDRTTTGTGYSFYSLKERHLSRQLNTAFLKIAKGNSKGRQCYL